MTTMSLITTSRRYAFLTLRACFRLLPMPVSTRDRMRQSFLDRHADWVPAGPRGQSASTTTPRRALNYAGGKAIGYREHRVEALPRPLSATLVAFYLPQFHTISENDTWWGEGFTEWCNVTRALPQFEGHVQPRLPGALGFYDLSQSEAMRRQMQLAREYGIGAFCSYFYWFAGKTLLEKPLRNWLGDPTFDLPICLCWANENWSRRWNGRADDVLIAQHHSPEDDLAFIAHIAPYLRDPRYLRIGGRPMLLVYRPGLLPDAVATARRWRAWCADNGIGAIHLAYVQSFDNIDPRDIGFDSAVAFPPNNTSLAPITAQQRLLNPDYRGDVYDWRELARDVMAKPDPPYPLHPCVNPGWDNEPRRSGAGRVFIHASPRGYRDWLRHAIATARRRQPAQPLVFINAWNEWAEGAVLEPDTRLGHAWLDATRAALHPAPPADTRPCAVLHLWYPELLDEFAAALHTSGIDWRVIITTAPKRVAAVCKRMKQLAFDAEVDVFENRGRDILPFLHVANRLLDEGVTTVLKLHGKRSTHRQDGDTWRRELLDKLLAPQLAASVLAAFRDDATLGMVHPDGHRQPLTYYWGANQRNVEYLNRRIGIPEPCAEHDTFIAGSMFWLRPAAIRPLLDAHLGTDEFEPESGQVDGTLAHAVERAFDLAVRSCGYHIASSNNLSGHVDTTDTPYPYARRSG